MTDPPSTPNSPLVLPIDKFVLTHLTNGRRQTPRNLAKIIKHNHPDTDITRNYIGNRLRALEIRGYLHSPGPADRSGMYEITTWGQIAAHHIEQYERGYDQLFHTLVTRTADSQPDTEHQLQLNEWDRDDPYPRPDPHRATLTDWIQLTGIEIAGLHALKNAQELIIPSNFRDDLAEQLDKKESVSANTAADILYTLHFFRFAKRHDGMDAYSISNDIMAQVDSHLIDARLREGGQLSNLLP